MLNEVYSGRKSLWENWEGFRNVIFMTGFVQGISRDNQELSFKIQQSTYQTERFNVIIKKGNYQPSDLVNNAPIKVIARVKQDIKADYPTLIMYPLKVSRPMFNEIPIDNTPINKDGTINNFIDFASLNELSKTKLQVKLQSFINRVQLAGFVYAKKVFDANTMMIQLWNGENRLIPVCIIGERYVAMARKVKQFMPIRVDGRLSFRTLDGKPQVCVVTKELRVAVGGNDIPKNEPEWLKQAIVKFYNNQVATVEEKPEPKLINEKLND
ncbi:MAG: hypothetical protein K2P99_04435 [Burkholderiales bacterium]|nr:hypothetical protein [Burkholderiales bacterium]